MAGASKSMALLTEDSSRQANQSLTFFNLPAEVRNHIYHYALLIEPDTMWTFYWKEKHQTSNDNHTLLALLLANKTVNFEAAGIYYAINNLYFWSFNDGKNYVHDFIEHVSADRWTALERVELRGCHLPENVTACLPALATLPRLQSLTLTALCQQKTEIQQFHYSDQSMGLAVGISRLEALCQLLLLFSPAYCSPFTELKKQHHNKVADLKDTLTAAIANGRVKRMVSAAWRTGVRLNHVSTGPTDTATDTHWLLNDKSVGMNGEHGS